MNDFRVWLELMEYEPGADFEVTFLDDASKSILLDIFNTYGWIDGSELRAHILNMTKRTADWALPLVICDFPKINFEGPWVGVAQEDSWHFDGYQGVFVNGHEISSIDRLGILLEVAENHQIDVIEYLNRAVPLCPDHPVVALKPKQVGDSAVWWCAAGAHVVAEIGALGHASGVSSCRDM